MIIKGKVRKGKGIGRSYGYPTLNVECAVEFEDGVYGAEVVIEKEKKPAIVIKGVVKNGIEVYVLDWEGNLYGEEAEVEIGEKIREIKYFDSTEELVKQIREDVQFAKRRAKLT